MERVFSPAAAALRLLRHHVLGPLVTIVAVRAGTVFVAHQVLQPVHQKLLELSTADGRRSTV